MTAEQFDTLMSVLNEINKNVLMITSKNTGKENYGLSDISSDLSNVESAVSSLESAIKSNSR